MVYMRSGFMRRGQREYRPRPQDWADMPMPGERGPYRVELRLSSKRIVEWTHQNIARAREHWSEIEKTRRARDNFEQIASARLYDRDFRILEIF